MGLNRKKTDEYFMRRALSLALRGTGRTSPNPLVGAVVVRDGKVLAEGFHEALGGLHAERAALEKVGDVRGADLYVNLEPCSHFGRTPPCAPLIAERGVARVVAGMTDPNGKVSGRGFEILQNHGVEVTAPVLEDECKEINRGFIRRVTLGRPWVTLKGAVGLDGGMALKGGESKWITGPDARRAAHRLRSEHDAILVGAGTVKADDPELTVRHSPGESPLRVVLDSSLSTDPGAKVFGPGTVFFTSDRTPRDKRTRATDRGAELEVLPSGPGGLPIAKVLATLAARGVNSLLVEGGPSVIASFLREGLADGLALFVSPRIMGKNMSFSGNLSFDSMGDTIMISNPRVRQIEKDFLLEGRIACSPAL